MPPPSKAGSKNGRDLDGDGDVDLADDPSRDLDRDGRIDADDREELDLDQDNDIDATDRSLAAKQSVGAALGLAKQGQSWLRPEAPQPNVSGPKVQ